MTIQEIQTRKEDQTFDCKSIEDNSTFSRHAKVGVNSTLVIWLIENVQIESKALAMPTVAFANADREVIAIGVSVKARKIEGVDQHTEKL